MLASELRESSDIFGIQGARRGPVGSGRDRREGNPDPSGALVRKVIGERSRVPGQEEHSRADWPHARNFHLSRATIPHACDDLSRTRSPGSRA